MGAHFRHMLHPPSTLLQVLTFLSERSCGSTTVKRWLSPGTWPMQPDVQKTNAWSAVQSLYGWVKHFLCYFARTINFPRKLSFTDNAKVHTRAIHHYQKHNGVQIRKKRPIHMLKSHMLKAIESGSRTNKNSLSSLGGYHEGTWKFMLRAGRGCC